MSRKAVFEVATLADAVAKAYRIAPNKGAAFDRAAGIVLEVNPGAAEPVIIKATDLDVTFRQSVSVLEVGDEPVIWRVSANLFNGIMGTLPIGVGSQVRLADNGDGNLYFMCGKTKAKLRLIVTEYPLVAKFDPAPLAPVPGFARRLAQVAWATDARQSGILAGVHMDGEYLYGCNRQVLAMVPCKVPVASPVTAPLSDISALIKNTAEVNLRADDNHMQIMPDPYTQATCVLFAGDYPKVRSLIKDDQTGTLNVKAADLTAALDRMLVLVKSERHPATTIKIGDGTLNLEMEVPDVGKIADEIEVQGGEASPKEAFVISFSPDSLKSALGASGREVVTIKYGPTPLSPVLVSDDNDFMSLLMPMRK